MTIGVSPNYRVIPTEEQVSAVEIDPVFEKAIDRILPGILSQIGKQAYN